MPSWGRTTVFSAEPRTANGHQGAEQQGQHVGDRSWCGRGATDQEIDFAASCTALSTSFLSTWSSLATFFCALSAAFSMASSIVVSPTITSAASPASMASPNSLTSVRDIPFHRCPLTPPMAAPTMADPMMEGGNKMPTSAPAAAPPQAPCRVVVSSLLTWTFPCVVLGDHRGVVGAHGAHGVEVLDDVVVGAGVDLAGVGPDVDEDAIGLRHGNAPFR